MDLNSHHQQVNEKSLDTENSGLSSRAVHTMKINPKFNDYLSNTKANKYHPQNNPKGIVPFGLAENKVAIDVLHPKLDTISRLQEDKGIYSYGAMCGEESLRESLKRFLEHNFHPREEIDIDQLIITNAVTCILENLAFALASPGEYIMITKPYYYRLTVDFSERPGVLGLPVDQPLPSETPDNRHTLDVPGLERAYHQATQEGKVVRAIHLTNPNNPTGDVYTAQELTDLLHFAHRHQLHVIANELYGLSVYDPDVEFTSILTLTLPDPERVHFLWGFSKDLGLSGIRIASLYTRNNALLQYFRQTGIYIRPTELSQNRLQHLIDDQDYMDNYALPEIRGRVRARHQSVRQAIEACGGRVHDSPATIFRWLDLSSFLPSPDYQGEDQLFQRLYSAGVHLMSGESLGHVVPGWFRMVAGLEEDVHREGRFLPSPDYQGEDQLFQRLYSAGVHLMSGESLGHVVPGWFRMVAGLEEDVHQEGMKRLVSVLNEIRNEKTQQQ